MAVVIYHAVAAFAARVCEKLETASTPTAERLTPFPESARVIYRKNPLDEVICQLKFPPILRIESELPAAFQDALSADYPLLEENPGPQLNLPPAIAKILAVDFGSAGTNRQFQFASSDAAWRVVLNREFIALSTTKYRRWEDFRSRLARALAAIDTQYKPPAFFVRVGLRYKDVIRRSEFGRADEQWNQLLKPHILGELSDSRAEPSILQAARQTLISLHERGAQVRLVHGLMVPPQGGEVCYSIDSDFFTQERTEVTDVFDVLKLFNRQAGRLFRWCITERLHDALGPEIIA
jgi:uncharacterized protein (TIGR04255 family)